MKKVIKIALTGLTTICIISSIICCKNYFNEKKFGIYKSYDEMISVCKEQGEKYLELLNNCNVEEAQEIASEKASNTIDRIAKAKEKLSNRNIEYSNIEYLNSIKSEKNLVIDDDKDYTVLLFGMNRTVDDNNDYVTVKLYFANDDPSAKVQYALEINENSDEDIKCNYISDEYYAISNTIDKILQDEEDCKTCNTELLKKIEDVENKEKQDEKQQDYKKNVISSQIVSIKCYDSIRLTSNVTEDKATINISDVGVNKFALVETLEKYTDNSVIDSYNDDEIRISDKRYLLVNENGEWNYIEETETGYNMFLTNSRDCEYREYINNGRSIDEQKQILDKVNKVEVTENTINISFLKINNIDEVNKKVNAEVVIKNGYNYPVNIDDGNMKIRIIVDSNGKTIEGISSCKELNILGKCAAHVNVEYNFLNCSENIEDIFNAPLKYNNSVDFRYKYVDLLRLY